eukprot:COSAG02_NODE_1088_length_14670_cov_237.088326_12_plen_87_part_00
MRKWVIQAHIYINILEGLYIFEYNFNQFPTFSRMRDQAEGPIISQYTVRKTCCATAVRYYYSCCRCVRSAWLRWRRKEVTLEVAAS